MNAINIEVLGWSSTFSIILGILESPFQRSAVIILKNSSPDRNVTFIESRIFSKGRGIKYQVENWTLPPFNFILGKCAFQNEDRVLQDLDTEVKVGRAAADRMLTAPGHQREGGCPSFLSEAQRPIAKNPWVAKDRKRRRGRTHLGRRNQQPRGCSSWRRWWEREARGRSPLGTEVGALGLEIRRVCVPGQL